MAIGNFLKQITERGAVDQSLYPLLFGELVNNPHYWYTTVDADLPRQAQGVLRLYFALIQAYCFAEAHHRNKTLKELDFPDKLINKVRSVWNVERPSAINSIDTLFSYFSVSSQSDMPEVFTPAANTHIKHIIHCTRALEGDSREMLSPISRESFLDYLDSLPLLKLTRFDSTAMKFEMRLPHATLQIKSSPFITFLSFEKSPVGESIDSFSNDCYILTDVSKGDLNNELFFDTLRIDKQFSDRDQCRLSRTVPSNESLALLCKTANIETGFYSIGSCLCDLKFLNTMVDATQRVLSRLFGMNEFSQDINIKDDLLYILNDSDQYRDEIINQDTIKYSQLNDLLFDLFLTEGLFKTIFYILHNPHSGQVGVTGSHLIYQNYLDALAEMGIISASNAAQLTAMCKEKIDTATKKLAAILPKNQPAYQKRAAEIQAEWETYYILHAAGIKNDDLFADVESILSIDDYYDMIGNEETTLEYDLKRVLRTLCVFYGALLDISMPFSENDFFESAKKVVKHYKLSDHTVESLLSALIQIADKCEHTPHIEELLGRRCLGDNAQNYLRHFERELCGNTTREAFFYRALVNNPNAWDIFISYAHDDIEQVRPIVNSLRNRGFRVFFDEIEIKHGHDWQSRVNKAIDQDTCKLFVAFCSKNSVGKEAVAYEIAYAHQCRNSKYPNDPEKQQSFLLLVNLEADTIESYLTCTGKTGEKEKHHIQKIEKCILSSNVFVPLTDHTAFDIEQVFDRLVSTDGRVIHRQELDAYKLRIANLYAYFKTGDPHDRDIQMIHDLFNGKEHDFPKCIFPIVASIKETKVKRENIAIVGYELICGKGRGKHDSNQILTSRTLEITDYYCIPKYRNAHDFKKWMVEPLLIRCDKFVEILSEGMMNNNG